MDVYRAKLEKYCGVRPGPGTTLARCSPDRRDRFLDPNLVSYAKIEIAFGAFCASPACSWDLGDARGLGVTGWSRAALGAPKLLR